MEYKSKRIDIALIVCIATMLIAIWFRKGLMMGGGECALPFYNPSRLFYLDRYTWYETILGRTYPSLLTTAPSDLVMILLESIGFSEVVLQASTFWILLVVGSLSIYFLTLETINKHERLAAIFAGFFYMLNPYTMTTIWHRFQITYMFFYALLPLALLLYIKGLLHHKVIYAFYVNLCCLAFSYAFGCVPFIGSLWIVLSLYLFFHILTNLRDRNEIIYAVKFSLIMFFLWFLLNAWWLLQFTMTAEWVLQQSSPRGDMPTLLAISENIRLHHLLRLINWYYTYIETTWGPIYSSPVFEIIAFLITLLVFSAILFKHKNNFVLYFTFFSLSALFLSKGASAPLGDVYIWIFTYFRPFQVFRSPLGKFGIIVPLGYAPLFGVGLSSLYDWAKRYSCTFPLSLIGLISLSILVVYPWPMWTGWVFTSPYPPQNNPEIGYYVAVPLYYSQANAWISRSPQDFRVIVLPMTAVGITYKWAYGYSGVELSNQLFDKPAVSVASNGVPYNRPIVGKLEDALITGRAFWKVMAMLNAKYIVVREDIDYEIENMRSPTLIKQALSSGLKHINYVRTFDKLTIYEINNDNFLPHIYATNQFIFSECIDTMLFKDIENDSFIPRNTVIFLVDQSNINDITLLENLKSNFLYKPDVSFGKIDPTRYLVQVKNASSPFFLIFSESYNPYWRAYIDDEQVPEKHHFIANGYANAWYINRTSSFEIILEFVPQRLLYTGITISLTTFIACVAYFGTKSLNKILKKE